MPRKELWFALFALVVASGLQTVAWRISGTASHSFHPVIITSELALMLVIAFCLNRPQTLAKRGYRFVSFLLLGLISVENISSLGFVSRQLIIEQKVFSGYELLAAALAIFLTNIIIFALWYWEIDSPGLSGKRWSRHDKDFQFTQQDSPRDYPNWRPAFIDYLYLSLTNGINFAAADVRPITGQAKALMGTQALVSVFTLALVLARSVSILGQ